jgi:uncharacterized ParB-like nuclease family protein
MIEQRELPLVRRIERYRVEDIYVGERLRALDPKAVATLAESMKTIGLQTPISVRRVEGPNTLRLVVGRHRLAAAQVLGWEEIDCLLLDKDDIDALLWEIDENLARAELTTDQKRDHLRRRKQLWEEQRRQAEIQVAHDAPPEVGYGKPPPQTKGFASETAAATGLSKSQINRLLADPKPEPQPEAKRPPPPSADEARGRVREMLASDGGWTDEEFDALWTDPYRRALLTACLLRPPLPNDDLGREADINDLSRHLATVLDMYRLLNEDKTLEMIVETLDRLSAIIEALKPGRRRQIAAAEGERHDE